MAANYAAAGVTRLVMARGLLQESHLLAVRQALPGYELTVVRLDVSPATALRRIGGRDSGATLEGHLGEVEEFHRKVAAAALEDFVVSNDGRPLAQVADEVLLKAAQFVQ